jgi:hypothetical protein
MVKFWSLLILSISWYLIGTSILTDLYCVMQCNWIEMTKPYKMVKWGDHCEDHFREKTKSINNKDMLMKIPVLFIFGYKANYLMTFFDSMSCNINHNIKS